MAKDQSTLNRRDAFTALGATGLAGIAGLCWAQPENLATIPKAPAGEDGPLLALVAELETVDAKYDALSGHWGDVVSVPDHVDAQLFVWGREAEALRLKVSAIPAATTAGTAAKARIGAALIDVFSDPEALGSQDRLLLSLCADVIRHSAAGASA